jgi:bifunctional DNA-binding transcriptional regulator/antitoxin component of YhaV-PrlF toxin-antitoxin module
MAITIQTKVQLDQQGHLVIPAELIQAFAIDNDTSVIAKVENGCLIIEKRESIRQRLKARFADIPAGVSLADELITERRREASQDTSL